MELSGIFIYPVKSLRGFSVDAAAVDALGLVGDRRFLVIDAQGRTLTQREIPRMALVGTQLTSENLILSHEGYGSFSVPLRSETAAKLVTVAVWKSTELVAEDCGADAAAWLTENLRMACRLVRIGDAFRRPVLNPARASATDVVNFADTYPFLVVGEASLENLNDRLLGAGEETVPMNRFRPNLVVRNSTSFAEDTWDRFQIGRIRFRTSGPCSRCIVTTTDQENGSRGKEPLRMLATYRRDSKEPSAVNFGQNLIHETKSGTLKLGDPVTLL